MGWLAGAWRRAGRPKSVKHPAAGTGSDRIGFPGQLVMGFLRPQDFRPPKKKKTGCDRFAGCISQRGIFAAVGLTANALARRNPAV